MFRMWSRRLSNLQLSSGSDQVLLGMSLPSDSVINDISGEVSAWNESNLVTTIVTFLAAELWLLPVFDPDAGANFDTLFDQLVPKDTDVETMDLDTGAADTSPFSEPGEVDWSTIFDVGVRPERLYKRSRLLTVQNGGSYYTFQDNQTPFAVKWRAGDNFRFRIKRRLRVRQPSVLVLAMGSPLLDDTSGTLQAAMAENEWPRIKYAQELLRMAMHHVLGLIEAGSETPWEEATALLKKHLEPDVYEETAAAFSGQQFNIAGRWTIDHSVPGELAPAQVSSGR